MQQGKTPFLRLLVPLCVGIIISDGFNLSWTPGMLFLAVALLSGVASIIIKKTEKEIFFGIAVMFFFTGVGYLLHHIGKEKPSVFHESEQRFLVRLKDFPEKKSNSYAFNASIEAAGPDLSLHPSGSFLIYYIADTLDGEWIPGDRLTINMAPRPIKNSGNPGEFNYSGYMEGRGTRYFGFIHPEDILSHATPARRSLRELSAIAARNMVITFIGAGLKGDELGLVTAFTIGEKDLLDKEQQMAFSRAGVMHVMAVSGLHVGMISLFLSALLFFMKHKWIIVKCIIILFTLWAFAFITGLSPSVMRATITFSFLQAGKLINRPGNSMNLLLASAFILLTGRPAMLFEAGFQLSYLAVIFIIAFYEPLYKLLKSKNRVTDYIWQMTAVSIVAQLGTFPLTVKLFNTFPVMFLLANIVIIPLSFIIMILAFFLILLSGIAPAAHIIAKILTFLSHLTLVFTSFISSLPHGVISEVGMTTGECLILTAAVTLLMISLFIPGRISIRPFLAVMIIFFSALCCKNIVEGRKEGLIVYNIKGKPLPAFVSGGCITVLSADSTTPVEVIRHASSYGFKIIQKDIAGSALKAECGEIKLAIIPAGRPEKYNTSDAEITIVPGAVYLKESYFSSGRSSPLLIASGVKPANMAKRAGIHIPGEKGAYLVISDTKNNRKK